MKAAIKCPNKVLVVSDEHGGVRLLIDGNAALVMHENEALVLARALRNKVSSARHVRRYERANRKAALAQPSSVAKEGAK